MQKNFLEKPRESIEDMIRKQNEAVKELTQLSIFQNRPDRLLLFLGFHKEYASLVRKMWQAKLIDGRLFKDDVDSVVNIQRVNEFADVISSYKRENEVKETTALRMGRAYASALEIFWKKLKRLVSSAGLNPRNKHLNIWELNNKISELETTYSVDLSQIKSILNSKLRNCVGHESTYFIPPDIVVFIDNKSGVSKEVAKLTTGELYVLLLNITIITMAFVSVENTAIIAMIEPLLKLSDEELEQFAKTGTFTPDMQNKIQNSQKN